MPLEKIKDQPPDSQEVISSIYNPISLVALKKTEFKFGHAFYLCFYASWGQFIYEDLTGQLLGYFEWSYFTLLLVI